MLVNIGEKKASQNFNSIFKDLTNLAAISLLSQDYHDNHFIAIGRAGDKA